MDDKKKLWMRVGVSVCLTDAEIEVLKSGNNEAARTLIRSKLRDGKSCELDGESYFPDEAYENAVLYEDDGSPFDGAITEFCF